jgi:hypothetical protein
MGKIEGEFTHPLPGQKRLAVGTGAEDQGGGIGIEIKREDPAQQGAADSKAPGFQGIEEAGGAGGLGGVKKGLERSDG